MVALVNATIHTGAAVHAESALLIDGIAPGMAADLVHLGDDLTLWAPWAGGKMERC